MELRPHQIILLSIILNIIGTSTIGDKYVLANNAAQVTSSSLKINNENSRRPHMDGSVKIDKDFFSFIKFLKTQIPMNIDFLSKIGIEPCIRGKTWYAVFYEGNPIILNDGTIFYEVSIRDVHSEDKNGIFLVLDVSGREITRQEFERHMGKFRLVGAPAGHSLSEVFGYSQDLGEYSIGATYSQDTPGILRSVVFDSVHRNK